MWGPNAYGRSGTPPQPPSIRTLSVTKCACCDISAKLYYIATCGFCDTFTVICPVNVLKTFNFIHNILLCWLLYCTYNGSLEIKCQVSGAKKFTQKFTFTPRCLQDHPRRRLLFFFRRTLKIKFKLTATVTLRVKSIYRQDKINNHSS